MSVCPAVRVLLETADPSRRDRAAELARRLGLALCEPEDIGCDEVILALSADGLELRGGDAARQRGVRVDFAVRSLAAAGRPGHAVRSQPLLRAVGRRSGRVFDATAGFGDDAIALASSGYHVTAVERSPVVAALLEDGLTRALADPRLRAGALRLELHCGDSRELLSALAQPPDVVYMDPMYPIDRSKSALPRRQIQLLRCLVGEDDDAGELFETALACGARRVVVKRPRRASPRPGPLADSHTGKLVRYDVYHGSAPRRD